MRGSSQRSVLGFRVTLHYVSSEEGIAKVSSSSRRNISNEGVFPEVCARVQGHASLGLH